jgi:predicted deacetylase
MIDQKLAIITIHDVNPNHSQEILTVTEQLNELNVKYNLSIVPYYNKKYRLEGYMDFCKQISSLLKDGHIDLTLHGLYHQVDGKIEILIHNQKKKKSKKSKKD